MKNNICKGVNFAECELAILRMAVDKAVEKIGKRVVNSPEIKQVIRIVEDYIQHKNLICYGGTAINNILPEDTQFYNKDFEIPDYDFFSFDAFHDAKELANIYYKQGFQDVEAKSGQHPGTYKVFVNYIPIADITQLPKQIFAALKIDAIRINGILYAPPNFLRMSMYLELSRPAGDTSRWEKVLKRLIVLNNHYPITNNSCKNVDFQRDFSGKHEHENKIDKHSKTENTFENEVYENVKQTFIEQGCVFFGGYAISLYSKYMPAKIKKVLLRIPDFDVLSNDPENTCQIVKGNLSKVGIKTVKIIKRESIGEIIPLHYEINVGNNTIAFIYKPVACHSYNTLNYKGQKVKIATIDTMLSFYFAFLYANKPYYNDFLERILCMARFLYEVQQKNRLSQHGLLRRFTITCYGHQESIEEIRANKALKYKELKNKSDSEEFDKLFLNYKPDEILGKRYKTNKMIKTNKNISKKYHNNKTHKSKQREKKQSRSIFDF